MRKVFAILFTGLVLCFSCEEQGFFVRCSECTEEEPVEVTLKITLDKNPYTPLTEVRVYEGNLEDNVLNRTITTTGRQTIALVPLNKKYTVTATYMYPNNEVFITVDSAYPRVSFDDEQCENPCYYIYDKTINLRLKYKN